MLLSMIREPSLQLQCDALKPEDPLTNRQPMENSWISGDPILYCYVLFIEIHNLVKKKKTDIVSFVRGDLSKT